MRILVVEDDPACRCMLVDVVSQYGACDEVEDGEDAVSAAEAAILHGAPYDLILMDIQMPCLDGQTALYGIRQLEEAAGLFPGKGAAVVVMTTGVSAASAIVESFREQCDGYLVKPIQAALLERMLDKCGLCRAP